MCARKDIAGSPEREIMNDVYSFCRSKLPHEELVLCAKEENCLCIVLCLNTIHSKLCVCVSADCTLLCETESRCVDALKAVAKFAID